MVKNTKNTRYINADKLTRAEALALMGKPIAFDIETYRNYFLASFYEPVSDIVYFFDTEHWFDKKKLIWFLVNLETYGFNSISFDMPICVAYCSNPDANSEFAYAMGQAIIAAGQGMAYYEVLKDYGLKFGWMDAYKKNHYDLKGPSFGQHSLKYYAAVLGIEELQDLPFHHDTCLTGEQKKIVLKYCAKDCFNTYRLHDALAGPMEIRAEFGMRYGLDLRSLQDAKVAEMLLVQDYTLRKGKPPEKPKLVAFQEITYNVPDYINFKTAPLQSLADELEGMKFRVIDGKIGLGAMEGRVINIDGYTYKMGIGGLHSQERKVTHIATDTCHLIDCDVGSYYPSLILRNGNFPRALGREFLATYGGFIKMRLEAKANKDKLMANGFKIPLNATFGKLGEQFGYLFAPELLVGVTLTGQLGLLMLIEALVVAGFEVISANTDGVVSKVPDDKLALYREILADWEKTTDFILEETHYSAIYSRDVNSYIAFYTGDEGYKAKGAYSEYGLTSLQAKVPNCQIVKDAVVAYLKDGTPVDHTIRNCKDFLQFTRAKNVKTGGYFNNERIGKVVRYYYSDTSDTGFVNALGHKVPEAWNTRPVMDLPDFIPKDISYSTYIAMARKIVNNDFTKPEHYGDLFT